MQSERWNSITTNARNKAELPQGQLLLTEKQWCRRGYVPVSTASGKTMWSNQMCQRSFRYLFDDEVRLMTFEERQKQKDEEREARASRKEKHLRMTRIPGYEAEINRLKENCIFMMKLAVNAALEGHKPAKNAVQTIILDTETTGTSDTDELLQISIIDLYGNEIYNSMIKPMFHDTWPGAADINHIRWKDVKKAPFLPEEAANITDYVAGAKTIIGYGITFDITILERYGIPWNADAEIIDVMEMFAPVYGKWSDKYCNYEWQSLTTCAAYFEYDWQKMKAHDSLADCHAALYCYNRLKEMEEKNNE